MWSYNSPVLTSESKHSANKRECSEDQLHSMGSKNKERLQEDNYSIFMKTGHAL